MSSSNYSKLVRKTDTIWGDIGISRLISTNEKNEKIIIHR